MHSVMYNMANIDNSFKGILQNEKYSIYIQISLNFISKSRVDKTLLVQVTACCRRYDTPSPEPMTTKVFHAIWRH